MTLRIVEDADLDELFEWERHPEAVAMAAFTHPDPSDRAAFDAHQQGIRTMPGVISRAIEEDGRFAGTIGSFDRDGDREVTYWIDPSRWGRGLASAALEALLRLDRTRPMFGRVAEHNVGSARVLERAGFVRVGSDSGYAEGLGREVVEHIYRLDA